MFEELSHCIQTVLPIFPEHFDVKGAYHPSVACLGTYLEIRQGEDKPQEGVII